MSENRQEAPAYVLVSAPDGEGQAAYRHGKLLTAGDSYLVVEKLLEELGVEVETADFFTPGKPQAYEHALPTLEAVRKLGREQARERASKEALAEELRTQAEALLAQAEKLEAE